MHSTEFVASYFDAWNQHDAEGVADHLAPNGIYRDVRQNARRNHGELVDYLKTFFSRYHHRYELVGDVLANDNTVAFQYRMLPTRESKGEDAEIYRGAEFITLVDASATLIDDYYDVPDAAVPRILEPRHSARRRRKYAKSGLAEDKLQAYMRELDRVMHVEEAFLDPGLTLPKLADRVGCSVNHLSQVINAGYGVSFFDFLSRYRIRRAKRMLNEAGDQAAVLKVAYSVGFNSNSAFYSAFKKRVGMTPAEFRRAVSD
jgi:AraC-like DNA-binding protein